ncbi:MAG: phosphotransferase enzyme family protein, partial [Candidatus Aminicenantales bacterium]
DRKIEIAETLTVLGRRLPEIPAPLPLPDGKFAAESDGGFWQLWPFVEGVPLRRPEYAGDGWRGPVLADFLVRLKSAAADLPQTGAKEVFSPAAFVRSLEHKISGLGDSLHERILPAFHRLETAYFPAEPGLSSGFAHGDFHPLNVVWSPEGIRAVVDWEFCGEKPEMYDAAILVGCLGMEDPRFLGGDFVYGLLDSLGQSAAYAPESRRSFFDLVLAIRFAWLSDWLRRGDAEMIDLEAVYLNLLLENREFFVRNWRL